MFSKQRTCQQGTQQLWTKMMSWMRAKGSLALLSVTSIVKVNAGDQWKHQREVLGMRGLYSCESRFPLKLPSRVWNCESRLVGVRKCVWHSPLSYLQFPASSSLTFLMVCVVWCCIHWLHRLKKRGLQDLCHVLREDSPRKYQIHTLPQGLLNWQWHPQNQKPSSISISSRKSYILGINLLPLKRFLFWGTKKWECNRCSETTWCHHLGDAPASRLTQWIDLKLASHLSGNLPHCVQW